MQILYGACGIYADVTNKFDNMRCFVIPHGDVERLKLLGVDPVPFVVKHIILISAPDSALTIPHTESVSVISDENGSISVFKFQPRPGKSLIDIYLDLEYPETAPLPVHSGMNEIITMLIEPDDKVLQLGAWTGTTSCIISKLLSNSENLVCLESNLDAVGFLLTNREINGFSFKVIVAALSESPLYRRRSSSLAKHPVKQCVPGAHDALEWISIPIISWEALGASTNRYHTLVADCDEGLYNICKTYPGFFSNFDKVIVENDYHTIEKKRFVEAELIRSGFILVWRASGEWGPCKEEFYEAWIKDLKTSSVK